MKKLAAFLVSALIACLCFAGCGEPKVTVQSVIDQLKEAGLPIEYSIVYTAKNDPNGGDKNAYLQKGNFADSTIESEYSKEQPLSGSIEIFSSKEKAIERAEYLAEFTFLDDFGYRVVGDCVLLRLNSQFDHSAVEKYAQAIGGEIYSEPEEKDNSLLESKENENSSNTAAESWEEYTKKYFPDAEVEKDGYGGALIFVSLGENNSDSFITNCFNVLSKLDGCKDGTMVTINITDDPGAAIVGFPSEDGIFGFECTAILSDNSALQESYGKTLGITNDRDFLKKGRELRDEIEKTEDEIEDILGEDIFE